MSINVDKMDSKHDDSLHKPKPVMKRRKKNSSASDLSSDSLSPKKRIPNGFAEEYRSSPETTFNSSYHNSIPMNGSLNTTNGHHNHLNGSVIDHTNDLNIMEVVSQNGSIRSIDSGSPMHSATANLHHHYDDSDSASSVNRSSGSSSGCSGDGGGGGGNGRRQPRTPEDFYLFCQFILEYANYNEMCSQETLRSSTHSPLDSTGSATESTTSSAMNDESNHAISTVNDSTKEELEDEGKDLDGSNTMLNDTSTDDVTKAMSAIDASSANEDEDSDVDADSYNLITCYCGKPYAGRPMIECSCCLTWLHLSCAKVKRKKIPELFYCVKCTKSTTGQQRPSLSATQTSSPPPPTTNHPKDHQSNNEPKENNRSKKSTASNTTMSQTRSDKLENNILQPLNVSAAAYETGANNIDNIKTTSTVSSIAVKYK
ncbi:PHD finger protein 23B-like [Sitodiplosis mosellana]|uniref:PHD finger protein 23B-like n=1 Tax=Sitodiplosis mosellana TaxID=263140 RepID=UPI00244383CE|nr:PHD finger protein 23B-like [Sitodiplosis mosellana]XP_055318688.1 PHD finger protein 23B-like [Sitodiplosis mosellana]XP_055318689.1 PHD finger protein 23B-like [Sitodiplosis mosellana]XP_055318690.1 PHD finger protein 23B-like [Sitodiplosis mosellana]XP_055318691.1 PHD finger protein 23B-like [Sitodiplosis mosellana]XP_055318692.1 PHD finger protein 23B-like [Sitodiplosis mosellana]XP_055318694.1 PHD finger protein 23B-like [Sitodiplosis mosellana]